MTFASLIQSLPEDQRYEVEERAAIHEFDGGLSRIGAEIRTVQDWKNDRFNRLRREADLL